MELSLWLSRLLPQKQVVCAIFASGNLVHRIRTGCSEVLESIATRYYQHVTLRIILRIGTFRISLYRQWWWWRNVTVGCLVKLNWCEKAHVACVALWNSCQKNERKETFLMNQIFLLSFYEWSKKGSIFIYLIVGRFQLIKWFLQTFIVMWRIIHCDVENNGSVPVTTGVDLPIFWARTVKRTPALVPTQMMSLHAKREVTRRQAALCCWMMLSQLLSILLTAGAKFTSQIVFRLKSKNIYW